MTVEIASFDRRGESEGSGDIRNRAPGRSPDANHVIDRLSARNGDPVHASRASGEGFQCPV